MIYQFVGFVWVSEFLMACQRLFIAGAVSMYYFDVMRSVENLVVKKILAVFVILLECIEKCLRYINYNVYTVISYSGFSFCPAAKMLWPTLSHPWFPLVIMFVCSYQIANCFLSVYEMAIDTILLCCAEELVLLRDNPEAVQQFRDYMDGTSEMMAQRNVRFLGATAIEETYPLNSMDGEKN
ncbi:hypothetical protein NECAME_04201 [Necator americanus]|uniref:Choline transporter-like protein n=1 Tax=Necator americanus TaxID=51031 RepID=W2SW51_NECAM|nr:hypothetical protein NECAME_04201 [Necator americanus]ETN73979.1 hypothetical protein NECAME_04201 [Necator americanus]